MTIIAVAPTKYSKGIGREGSQPDYVQRDLEEALADDYATDAHLVSYVDISRSDGRQYRTRKSDLGTIVDPSSLVFTCIFVDVDNPNHAAWDDETIAAAIAQFAALPLPCGVYLTAHGARLVLPLLEPVSILRAERVIRAVLSQLDAAGVRVDWVAKDWTRHFRLPNVRRNGRFARARHLDLSRMRAVRIDVPDDDVDEPSPASAERPRGRRPAPPPMVWTTKLAEHWQERARVVAAAIRANVSGDFHEMYLAIGGALLARATPPEHVPELVRLIATNAGSVKPAHHEKSARDTVARHAAGLVVTGFRKLSARWPEVADALADALEDATPRPPPSPANRAKLAEATEGLYRAIRDAGDGLTVIHAECGLGKTYAAQRVAVERARKLHLTVLNSTRAPAQSKTAISVDKNELAKQVAADIAAEGVAVRRIFGPLSIKGEDECIHAARATPLVAGGQSLQVEFCLGRGTERCERYSTCKIRDGEEILGEGTPRITVGTHALLGELGGFAGKSGTLVVDEPSKLVETETFSFDDIDVALSRLFDFELGFANAMSPLLLAIKEWSDPRESFVERTAHVERVEFDLKRPPLRASGSSMARKSIRFAREIGTASRVLLALMRAWQKDRIVEVRLEDDPRLVVVTSTREDLTAALRREGSIVAMDANADLHMPGFEKVVGYAPFLHRFDAVDGQPIERTFLRSAACSRRAWIAFGTLVWDTGVVNAIREVVEWAAATVLDEIRPIKLGIITMRIVELAILGALRPNDASIDAAWAAAKQEPKALAEARVRLGEIFAPHRFEISTAHYGATRGTNAMKDVDCLATIGDPWISVPAVQTEAAFLGVDWEERLRGLCEAELEQAHGRIRAPHREKPGRALHVGRVEPSGSAWRSDAVIRRRVTGGRPSGRAAMTLAELESAIERLGGVRSAARVIGCAHTTIERYRTGRSVPLAVACVLRNSG